MQTVTLIALLTVFYCCTFSDQSELNTSLSLPINAAIVTKSYVYKVDSDYVFCQSNSIDINTLRSCIIQAGSSKYIRKATFLLGDGGETQELRIYHPEGPIYYSQSELLNDTAISSPWKINVLGPNSIHVDASNGFVIDNGDTLKITDHWLNQKFIFTQLTGSGKNARDNGSLEYWIIYSYK